MTLKGTAMMPKGTATFSPCGRYRYLLTRQWHVGDPAMCAWWMLNPSNADADNDDLTVVKICGFSQRWGFGGAIVVNMFALISTKPKIMLTDNDPVGPDNDTHLRSVLRDMPTVARIVCAWGNLPWRDNGRTTYWSRVDGWARDLKHDRRSVCLGRTKTMGEPRHPSRLGYATEVEPFLYCYGARESHENLSRAARTTHGLALKASAARFSFQGDEPEEA